jgi:hypothetical protein
MFGRVAGLCAVVVVAAVAAAGAGATARVSAPLPALTSFVLAPGDFSAGGQVVSQSTRTVGNEQMFTRVQKVGRIGSTIFLTSVSLALVEPDEPTAALGFAEFKGEAQSTSGRQAFAKAFALEFVRGVKTGSHGKVKVTVKHTTVSAPVLLGESALRMPLTITTNVGSLHMAIEVTQTERVVAIVELMPDFNRPLRTADANTALTDVEQHLHDAFTVANTSLPTTGGAAAQGQVVTLDEGSWTGAPSSFTYVWSHCDASGANCTPIAGATGKTYTVGAADVGYTLRVTVTGTNSVGSQQAVSNATGVVA